jgi:Rrf2 family cysteine metabolism transcriptional repressor
MFCGHRCPTSDNAREEEPEALKLSQKCQYAVRAILELSLRYGDRPVSAATISESQSVPKRFMEVILNELRPTGLITARRGAHGGYTLARPPAQICVGDVIRIVDGPLDPVHCSGDSNESCCPRHPLCSLIPLWTRAREAVESVYDQTNFQELADQERELAQHGPDNYSI